MWDVWIHILGIGAECACWRAGGPVCRPYGGDVVSPGGASGRPRPTKGAAGGWGHPPLRRTEFGQKTRAHTVRPYTIIINGSAYKKRDRFRTCPLKPRGEAKLRTKFLCLLSFSKKVRGSGGKPEPLTCVCCKGEGEMGDMYDYWVR